MDEEKRDNPLLERHPKYLENEPEWRLYYDAWRGGRYWKSSSYLFQHPREKNNEFAQRQLRGYYLNMCGPMVDIHTSNIFRPGVVRDGLEAGEFLKNCDRKGTSWQTFMNQISDYAKVFGAYHVLVDRPRFPENRPRTKAVSVEMGLDPYAIGYMPLDLLDWETDVDGQPLWCKFRERADRKLDPLSKRPKNKWQYKVWTREYWELYDEEGTRLDDAEHGLGIVPMVTCYHRRGEDPLIGLSFLGDIAPLNRSVYNWCSLLDQILFDQTFSLLIIPDDGGENLNEREIGTSKALTYPAGGSAPNFIAPDSSPAQTISQQIGAGIQQIERLAFTDQEKGTSNVSEETRSYDFNEMNNSLARQAGNLQEFEEAFFTIRSAWLQEDFRGSIQYPQDFSVASLATEMTDAGQALAFDFGELFEAELKKRLAQKILPMLPPEKRDLIAGEIEERVKVAREFVEENVLNGRGVFGTGGKKPAPGGFGQVKVEPTGETEEAA